MTKRTALIGCCEKKTMLDIFKGGNEFLKLLKVTVHAGTNQTIEIEIFVEYKYTVNELLIKKSFSIRLIVCET